MANPDLAPDALAKPAKGSRWAELRDKRKAIVAQEDAVKAEVRRLDQYTCRWPSCENCRRYKPRLEAAHVVRAKGMGGDHGTVTTIRHLMLLDMLTHGEQERGDREIRPLTAEGTRGPCEFWVKTKDNGWFLVARESQPFMVERD